MRPISGVRFWLLLVVLSGMPLSPAAAQKPKPKPTPKAVAPAKPPAPPAPPVAPEPPPPQQWKMVTRYDSAGQSSSITAYMAAERQRVEVGPDSAVLTQCDAKRVLQLSEKAKAYAAIPLAAPEAAAAPAVAADRVLVRTVVTDTGERRTIHGHEARRLRIVSTTEPGPGCETKKSRTESDGWYAQVPDLQVCALVPVRATQAATTCSEQRAAENTDTAQTGYPLAYTTITYDASDKEVSRISAEVASLTREPRSDALFEPPAAFAQLPDADALTAAARRAELEALGTTPKAAGMIRVGVVLPADASGRSVDREALGNELLEAFSEGKIEAVPIEAPTAADQAAEAATKECDFVLRAELAQLTTSKPGRIGGLVRRAAGGGNPTELHEARINFELTAVRAAGAPRKQTATAKTGGFTWRRAVGLARFAAKLYVGMTAGVMNALVSASSGGTAGIGDPTLNAMFSLLPGEKAEEEPHSPEAVIVAAIERGAIELKRGLAPAK